MTRKVSASAPREEPEAARLRKELENERTNFQRLLQEFQTEKSRSEQIISGLKDEHKQKLTALNSRVKGMENYIRDMEAKPAALKIIELEHQLESSKKENKRLIQRLETAQKVEDDLSHALDLNKELHSQLEASRMSSRICDSDTEEDEDVDELKQKLKETEMEVSELKAQLEESFTASTAQTHCKGCKFWRSQVELLKSQVQNRELVIAGLEAANHQLRAELDIAKHDIQNWERETETLKQSIREDVSDGECEKGLDYLLRLLERQSGELKELYPHRNQLAALVVKLQQKLNDIEAQLPEEAKETTEESISESSEGMEKLMNDITEILPETVKEFTKEIADQPVETQIFEVVRLLVDAQNAPLYQSNSVEVTPTRDPEIIGYLEEAMNFIRSMAGDTKDMGTKRAICHQCQKIKNFISEKEIRPADVTSVFTCREYDKIIKEVGELAENKEVLESSPVRELFALFSGVLGANALLTERNAQIHRQMQKHRQDVDTERRHKEKAMETAKRQKEDIETIRKRLGHVVEMEDQDVFKTVSTVITELQSSRKTCATQKAKILEQEQTIKAIKAADRTAEFKKKCHKRGKMIATLKDALVKEKEDREAVLSQLQAHLDVLEQRLKEAELEKKELEELKIKYEKMKEYKEKCKALEKEITELEAKIQDLEITLERAQQDNERLEGVVARLQEKIKQAEAQIRADRERKSQLKARIEELEKQNAEEISELRKSNETLQKTHEQMKEKLEKVIDELHDQILKYQAIIREFEDSKLERHKVVVKAKLAERAIATSLQDALTSMKNAEAQMCAQQKSFGTKLQALEDNYINNITKWRKAIAKLFDVNPDDYPTMNSLIELMTELYDPALVADAVRAKSQLALDTNQTLVDGITSLKTTISEQEQELISQKDKIQQLIQKSHVIKTSLDESLAKQKTLQKWVEWANCLYMSVMNDRILPSTDEDLRLELENLITGSTDAKHATRHLQILRTEKAAYKQFGDRRLTQKSHAKVPHLRAIALLCLFAQRLCELTNHTDMS